MTFCKSLQIFQQVSLTGIHQNDKKWLNDSLANFMKSFVSEKIKVHFVKSQKKVINYELYKSLKLIPKNLPPRTDKVALLGLTPRPTWFVAVHRYSPASVNTRLVTVRAKLVIELP